MNHGKKLRKKIYGFQESKTKKPKTEWLDVFGNEIFGF